MKKYAVATLVIVLTLLGNASANAGYADNPLPDSQRQYQWVSPPKSRPYIQLDAPYADEVFASGLNADKALMPYVVEQTDTGIRICQTVTLDCLSRSTLVPIMGFFKLCTDDERVACIDSINYKLADGSWAPATVTEKVDETPIALPNSFEHTSTIGDLGWKSMPEIGLPGSAKGPLVITLPGIKNAAGTDTYVLMADYWMEKRSQYPQPFQGSLRSFDMSVRPVYLDKTHGNSMFRWTYVQPDGSENLAGTGTFQVDFNDESIAESNKDEIGWAADFQDKTDLRVSLRMPKGLGGWFQSRLADPGIKVSSFDSTTNLVEIEGSPVVVPATEGVINLNDPDAKEQVVQTFGQSTWDYWASHGNPNIKGTWTWTTWRPDAGVQEFLKWKNLVGDIASGTSTVWNVSHIDSQSNCMNDNSSFQGLVNTNALVYQPNVPTFDGSFLKYKVAGQHHDWKGQLFQGTYSFIMRDSVARCLYGFSNAPISGTVSVTSSAGAEQVAYTNVTDKDGWLTLTAQGFTFSDPTISAKLTQVPEVKPIPSGTPTSTSPASGTPTPSPTPSKTANSGKLNSIICVKGKVVRRVTGVTPKCPAGYKKKA
jgi:hypothetical protein